MWRVEIRLAGAGGQGLGLAAVVLAQSALAGGYEAALTQAYGPEARGGASHADVVIADGPIANPRVEHPTILLVLNQKAWHRFADCISRPVLPEGEQKVRRAGSDSSMSGTDRCGASREGPLVVIDGQRVHPDRAISGVIALPFEQIARDELREKIAANMIAVGALGRLIARIPLVVLERTAEARSPEGFGRVNREAVSRGWALMAGILPASG
jgi:2-oxoglutarate ferredoxin oxidoreductase subunit gamma